MQEQTNEYNPGQETEQPNDQDRNQNVVTETDVATHHTQYEPPAAEVDSTGTDDNNDGA